MTIRTSVSFVTFKHPFTLSELDGLHPPGTFEVETDEQVIEGNERNAYIRVATLIHLVDGGTCRIVTVDPVGLETASKLDETR